MTPETRRAAAADEPVTVGGPRVKGVYASLASVISGSASQAAVTALVSEFYAIAAAYLRVSASSTRHLLSLLDLSVEDAAYDSIADLFARDSNLSFPVLARWWKNLPASCKSSDVEISLATRRLVIGAVHQRVFGMYRDSDPQMAKLLRNIKLALKRHPTVRRAAVGGDSVIAHRSSSSLRADLPPIPQELLLPEVFDAILPGADLKEILGAIGEALRGLKRYRKYITVVEAAVIIRAVYTSGPRYQLDEVLPDSLTIDEINALVKGALAGAQGALFARYQRRGILSPGEAQAIGQAIGDILRRMCLPDTAEESNFAILKKYSPSLTAEEYRKKERSILEYLVRKAVLLIRLRLQNQRM